MSISSIPSKYGIGCFSKEAYEFVDFLRDSAQSYWQILPIGHTGFGDSPYQSFSSFAGNPYFISLEDIGADPDVLRNIDFGKDESRVDYGMQYRYRYKILRCAYESTKLDGNAEFEKFQEENSFWLDDYAMFTALKRVNGGRAWNEWDTLYADEDELKFSKYIQFEFFGQWAKLKKYANDNGIKIIGDIPIYVAYDSADVWKNPNLFELDSAGKPRNVAGCPPDGFSENGQLWGNPVYRWEEHKKDGYRWWLKRFEKAFAVYDIVRLDHFRGFDEYYSVPYGSETAKFGKWKKAPGRELFSKVREKFRERAVIAEDLGFITESVKNLLEECGFMGMKVMEFAFDGRDNNGANLYLPHNYPNNCAAYSSTHDNEPVTSWFESISESERESVRRYLCDQYTPERDIAFPLISRIMQSDAGICIVPIQDYLKKGNGSRMNTPNTREGNWAWRIRKGELTDELKKTISDLCKTYGR